MLEEPRFQDESSSMLPAVAEILSKPKAGKFPKSARLLTRSQYQFLHRHSSRLFGLHISIDYRQGRSISPKLGITVSRKFGKAHDRNRFKRVVREAFRELYPSLPEDLELNISPRNNKAQLSKHTILIELKSLLGKILRLNHWAHWPLPAILTCVLGWDAGRSGKIADIQVSRTQNSGY